MARKRVNSRVSGGDQRKKRNPERGASARRGSRKSRGPSNRRVGPEESGKQRGRRSPADPQDLRVRNRSFLLIFILVLVNGYVFFWRDEGGIDSFQTGRVALNKQPELAVASVARQNACGGDPVDIFSGLAGSLRTESRLSEGRTLRLALLKLGVEGDEIDVVEASIRSTMDLGLLSGSGAPLRLASDAQGRVMALELELADGHLIQGCRESEGMKVRNIQHPFRMDVAVVSLELGRNASLAEAVEQIDESPDLAPIIADTLAHYVDFMVESEPGDRVQLLIQKRYLGHRFHRYGAVLAIRYIGAAGRLAFYRYKPEGSEPAFFDHKGMPMLRGIRRSPVAWYPADPDGRASRAPRIEFVEGRAGAIYRRGRGAPVVALGHGHVHAIKVLADRGLELRLRLDDGKTVIYQNLLRTVGDLAVGQELQQGQLVALVGSSGKTPVTRLRLEVLDTEGEPLDPMLSSLRGANAATRVGDPISKAQQDQFKKDIVPWRSALRAADLG